MFGSFGTLPIDRATLLRRSLPFPVAEAEVSLGTPSTQALSRKLEDIILELTFFGATASDRVATWKELARSREPQQLVISGRPEGLYWIALVDEEVKHAVDVRVDSTVIRVSFKEVGAFAWAGNYSPYEPPQNVRASAEAGVSGLTKGVLDWLKQ